MANAYELTTQDGRCGDWDATPIGGQATWTAEQSIAAALIFAVVFLNGADFRGDTGEDFTIHWQIFLRLGVCFAAGTIGLLWLGRTVREFVLWPGMLLTGYVGVTGVSLLVSQQKSYSAAAWLSLCGVVLFLPAAMKCLGGARYLLVFAFSLAVYLIASWIAYLFFPEVGVFHEQVTQTDVYTRMGGLAHPNELGFYSAYCTLIFASLHGARRLGPWLTLIGIGLGVATLATCFSRTAMAAGLIGCITMYSASIRRPGNLALLFGAVVVSLLVAFVAVGSGQLDWFLDDVALKLTKSGSLDELATVTGRTDIWAAAVDFIGQSPVLGYGYCSARFVMEDFSYHGHNILLNSMLFAGVGCGLLVLLMILYFLRSMLVDPRPEVDGLVACFLAGGMVDGLMASASPAALSSVWITVLLWRQLEMPNSFVRQAGSTADTSDLDRLPANM